MNVRELIRELRKVPPDMDVMVWEDEEDDYVDVAQVLYEDGVSYIQLLTYQVDVVEAEPEE